MTNSDYYIRIYNAAKAREGKPDPEKSFSAFQKNAGLTRKMLSITKALFEKETANLHDTYSAKKSLEIYTEKKAWYDAVVNYAKQEIQNNLEEVIASKKAQIRKVSAAPSEEDLRLLQTLKMRSNLTKEEVAHAAEALGANLPALALLRDIAEQSKITLPVYTVGELEEMLAKAEEFASAMINNIDKPYDELTYHEVCFYDHPDQEKTLAYQLFHDLDTSAFTAEDLKAVIPSTLDANAVIKNYSGKPNAIEITLYGKERLGNLLVQFRTDRATVERLNPNLCLDELHAGDKVIFPANRMAVTDVDGYAKPFQCEPTYSEYAANRNEGKTEGKA